ncbi:efflux RND transporter periplasmic adaptor subunit [Marinobacter sp. JSM 1782161]|uniref:efflux RND transporter periplasmic adaptor subunit n=1 Tax=Marinobacter sp. JSM 1782161 TaxID=2685906 RepID=UPI001402C77C|nr:efflux RND transporter periplasmic adaptor subunit [Marinobacter sp. JSM 1782161]
MSVDQKSLRDQGQSSNRRMTPARGLFQAVLCLGVLVAGAGIAWLLLGTAEEAGRQPPAERSKRLVEIEVAERRSHQVTVTAWGQVQPSHALTLTPRVSGRVVSLADNFDAGSVLASGESLLQLDPRDYELALTRARSALTQARADLSLEQGQQAVAQREYELLGENVSDAERSLILRRPQLETAQAAVAAAEADLAEARLNLERTGITAPFEAMVLSRAVAEGAEVSTGTTLAELVGVDTWWLELTVPVNALKWVRFPGSDSKGSTVQLRYEGVWPTDVSREGRVVRLLGQLEEGGRMAQVRVAVQDPLARGSGQANQPRLLLGAYVRGEIQGAAVPDAVALQPEWVHSGNIVWLMDDNDELAMRQVTIAYRDGERVLVTDGIEDGDRIVTSQISVVTEGMPLRVQEVDTDSSRDGGGDV